MHNLKITSIITFLSGFCALIAQRTSAQNNVLDQTFGTAGMTQTDINTGYDNAFCTTIQPDGKILVGGTTISGSASAIAVARYNTNGTLDASFGTNGIAVTTLLNRSWANAIAVQPDGKIVVAGATGGTGSETDLCIVRYTSAGVPDPSFDTDGIIILNINPNEEAYDLAIQPDGKILVSGTTNPGPGFDFLLLRRNSDGSPDTSFGTTGMVGRDLGGNYEYGESMCLQSDGKIVITGSTYVTERLVALLRFNTDGSPDLTFSWFGATILASSVNSGAYSLAMQGEKFIVGGRMSGSGNYDFAVFRFLSTGGIDNTFGTEGKIVFDHGGVDNLISSVIVQPDGKIIACGTFYDFGQESSGYITRLNAEGDIDLTFNNTGSVITSITGNSYEVMDAALQSDEKLVTAGVASAGGNSQFVVARYLNEGFVSTGEIQSATTIQVYPNPAETTLTIAGISAEKYGTGFSITDQCGRILLQGTLTAAATVLDLSALRTGMYQVRIDGEAVVPVVKQ